MHSALMVTIMDSALMVTMMHFALMVSIVHSALMLTYLDTWGGFEATKTAPWRVGDSATLVNSLSPADD